MKVSLRKIQIQSKYSEKRKPIEKNPKPKPVMQMRLKKTTQISIYEIALKISKQVYRKPKPNVKNPKLKPVIQIP